MNKTKSEIEKYLNERHKYFMSKKSNAKSIHEIRLYSNEMTEFVKHLQDNVLRIIRENGITHEKKINELIDSLKEKTLMIVKDISIGS